MTNRIGRPPILGETRSLAMMLRFSPAQKEALRAAGLGTATDAARALLNLVDYHEMEIFQENKETGKLPYAVTKIEGGSEGN